MKKIKGFSYDTQKDMDAIDHIAQQPHQANYILNLVRDDMVEKISMEDLVKMYVREYCKEMNISIKEDVINNMSMDSTTDILKMGK